MNIVPVDYLVENIGQVVKTSKKRYIWKFKIDNSSVQTVIFKYSFYSNKKIIMINGIKKFEVIDKASSNFQYSFSVVKADCTIIQQGDQFELRINNKIFSNLYSQHLQEKELRFEKEEDIDTLNAYKDFTRVQKVNINIDFKKNESKADENFEADFQPFKIDINKNFQDFSKFETNQAKPNEFFQPFSFDQPQQSQQQNFDLLDDTPNQQQKQQQTQQSVNDMNDFFGNTTQQQQQQQQPQINQNLDLLNSGIDFGQNNQQIQKHNSNEKRINNIIEFEPQQQVNQFNAGPFGDFNQNQAQQQIPKQQNLFDF